MIVYAYHVPTQGVDQPQIVKIENLGPQPHCVGTRSNGTATWLPLDIDAGTDGFICFIPDIEDRMPRANKGRHSIVEVSG